MVFTVGVFGSSVSRDLFNSQIVPNYKTFFQIISYSQRTSIISLMQNNIKFDEKDIIFENDYNNSIRYDLSKCWLSEIANNPPDYIIMDVIYELIFGILILDDGNIITNNYWDLPKTKFYETIKDKSTALTIIEDSKTYFKLYEESIDLFFNFLKNNCQSSKIILNSARYATKILKKDKTIVDESGNSYLLNVNSYIEDLELYIENNYDVEIMYFGRDYLADESHIWGSGRTHYEKSYYSDKFNQLKHIVEFDNISKNYQFLTDKNLNYEKEIEQLLFQQKILKEKLIKIRDQKKFYCKNNGVLRKENMFLKKKLGENL